MVKPSGSKLLNLLQKEKGFDPKKDKQKRLRKQAEKRKNKKAQQQHAEDDNSSEEDEVEGGVAVNGSAREDSSSGADEAEKQIRSEARKASTEKDESEEDDESDEEETSKIDLSRLEEDDSDSSGEELEDPDNDSDEDDEEEEDIPLSDLDSVASDEKGDIIPHQRLTINNTSALLAALHRIEWKTKKLPFSDHQAVTSDAAVEIADTNDDLNRELAFYQQALEGAKHARAALKKEGVPFSRPTDYFAEMVKSDEHMGKVKQKLIDEAAGKKAAAEARRQRDLKKFGKAVQVAKEQEKAKAKKDTMEKINLLKRKRQGADLENENENDLFDVALEDAAETARKEKQARRAAGPNPKRAKKDSKYGFGGKKRFAKSNDANSSADMKGFSVKKMKAGGPGGAKKRPGKSRRAARK
ncbi:Eukaryotic rRNA processing [Macrophomina phaseolina MS6]|uniref:Eukaryotic rRNA processing n=2 Tax=Macrophomina phaseolina TaxID=35725 RepID=K2SFL2_MACPH|nr:Eukaryotic rRNA processing [Macrophomina phaseolina MS6]KAH7038908.1 eukaryotic rRNA processing protein EBP2-containing protein [Macrophomina phaseolina]